MYKLLLCLRYLRTRFLAVICIVSVMLGVATLVVVNSVMSGFSTKLRDRLHGLLSDIVIETPNINGFRYTDDEMKERILNSAAGPYIEAMTPTIEVVAMMSFEYTVKDERDPAYALWGPRQKVTRPVHLIGVDAKGRSAIMGFAEYLKGADRQANPSFALDGEGQKWFDFQNPPEQFPLPMPVPDGWPQGIPPPEPAPVTPRDPKGVIVGLAIASYREKIPNIKDEYRDRYLLYPGDTVNILTIGTGKREIEPVYSPFVVVDYFNSEMAEYDSNYVFVPLDYLQSIRGTPGRSTHIQFKLKNYADADLVVKHLEDVFPDRYNFRIAKWEDKQGALLGAIDIERGILNILLFMIIGVAGFSILAIFSMIVVEKTRDIGILKSLGASNRGVMSIFLGYGLLLGVVGAALGTALGLAITFYINDIENWLSHVMGRQIFPRDIYYFDKIPTNVEAMNVLLLNAGAIVIAVVFSILPALRAAMLHPVRALRYE